MDDSSRQTSGESTPNSRFTSQAPTAEDSLKERTYGLVHLSDFRKRRAEAREQSEREQDGSSAASGAATPDGRDAAAKAVFKKRKKVVRKGVLSFGDDEAAESGETSAVATPAATSRSGTPAGTAPALYVEAEDTVEPGALPKKRSKANAAISYAPKAKTKSSLAREGQLKEQLRKEYHQIQEAVKATEIIVPFTFYDGKSSPGGTCRVKKGDHIWLFLERARKVGADMAGRGDRTKKDWARIGVDDLMLVRGDLVIPHHYDFYHFIINRAIGYDKQPLFSYAAEATPTTPAHLLPIKAGTNPETDPNLLSTAASRAQAKALAMPDSELEGVSNDAGLTKVVDRRWYERNKHIFPASTWEEYDATRDYSKGVRKDTEGNAFFFGGR
ncbi:hypothetical protein LTR08_006985 [Meristemomyces frigidus]|nr:hypothetical protein LTR08_006985 [Meristemomyces frigidus]